MEVVEEDATNGISQKDFLVKEPITTKKDLRKLKRPTPDSDASDHHQHHTPNRKEPLDEVDDEVKDLKSNSKGATPNGDLKKDSSSGDETVDDDSSPQEQQSYGENVDHPDHASSPDSPVIVDITQETKQSSTSATEKNQQQQDDETNEKEGGDDDDDRDDVEMEEYSSDSDDQVLADIAKSNTTPRITSTEKGDEDVGKNCSENVNKTKQSSKRPRRGSKEQTIIVTETKSLAQAINEAVKKPDGKPTLVIIETKTPSNANTNSNGMVTSTSTSSTTATTKSIVKLPPTSLSQQLPSHNSLRSALLQGSAGMSTRSQSSRPYLSQSAILKQSAKVETSTQQGLALKDDAEINVYTPSLLVPYLFECPPKESLKDFLKKTAPPEAALDEEKAKKEQEAATDDCEPPLPKPPVKPKTFFDSALGQFFTDIGLSQVQQWVQVEIYKSEKRKLDRGWKTKDRERMVKSLQKTLEEIKQKNKPFVFTMKRCKRCSFTTESEIVMERHLETIHISGAKMLCSFCSFESTDPSQIFQHLFSQHKAFGRLERPPNTHMCPMCPFEDSAKARVTRHSWKCAKTFVPEKNLCPSPDFEPPAKRIRHVASVATLKAMRAGVDKSDVGTTGASSAQLQNRGCTSLLTPLLAAQQRGPPPIRPKPGDLRLTPTYVQSVLRGSYVSPARSPYSGLLATSNTYVRTSTPLQTSTQSSFLASRTGQQPSSLNSASYSLQGNQIYQVVHTSSGTNVPVFRGGSVTSFTPPRFTILPTPPAIVNTRGPTPVALIPNLATTNKPASGSSTSVTSSVSSSGKSAVSVSTTSLHSSISSTILGKKPSQSSTSQFSSKPNISITPVSKPTATRSSISTPNLNKSGASSLQLSQSRPQQQHHHQQQQQQQGSNPSYVVCEICDGYIKDLDQLRNHMQWIHKVKIHPKMIHNRPPLNCQKCHFRFFTDQGLERHLLGSHGLVTSSMQENANKGKDGGRCIICGKVFLWKLVVHMAKDHKMTLKPAHLSYKCTVCSATFNMYRLFETHVYEEHSTVAKRVLDGQKTYPPVQSSSSSQSSSTKAKVTITPTSMASSSSSSASSSSTSLANKERKSLAVTPVNDKSSPAEGRCHSTETRLCKDCGTKFQPHINCQGHSGGKASAKTCQFKLCRVDKCAKCAVKKEKEEPVAVVEEPESALNGKPSKRDHHVEVKHESSKTSPQQIPNKKIKIEVEYEPKTEPQAEQSDGDDVFDMEVETVDDDHSSPGDVHTDVESD